MPNSVPPHRVPNQPDVMSLSPGTRFGRYDIVCPLGVGGMGEVYRARDTRLGRELAVKILPHSLSARPEDLERFEREACSASSLNHPNIVTIFELGQVDGTYYIAMELVEGELLREMLKAGSIPLQKALSIAAQAADGLAKAHEAGVIHRDLKPDNLMVSRDGFVKILDFGLAKIGPPVTERLSDAKTLGRSQTHPGAILGTIEYMSPEQASGQALDFRSDQFSFGLVLYEMLTGNRAFRRDSSAETLAAILRDDPQPLASVNPQAPAPLCWVIERCLSKKPGQRYDSTRDLARDLAAIRDRVSDLPARQSPTRSSNLPPQRTAFVGRQAEIASAKQLLLRDDVHLLTLTGPGGIGKTRLGVQVANEIADQFPSGVFFVPLAALRDPALVPSAIAQVLGVKENERESINEILKQHLTDLHGKLLLFLDNFEHLLAAASQVAEWLTAGPQLKILVTSRSPLHIYGEREFPIPPLALPGLRRSMSVEALAKNPAVSLFVDRAAAVKPDFRLTEENALAVATICTRLDGLPLAIELAAARVKLLSPSAMQARLESRLQLLTGGARDLPERQQTLRGTIDWSYDLLNSSEQRLFRRVSVFVNGCTLEAVEAVCNTKLDLGLDVLEGMASLVDKSLVRQTEQYGGEPRFVMLDTVREYGVECLSGSGEEHATRQAHAAYYLVLAEECASDPGKIECLQSFDIEHDNFRAALDWLTDTENAEWGLRLGAALFQFWETREHLQEGRDRLAKLLKIRGADSHPNTRARVLFAAGVLGEVGNDSSAIAFFEESRKICRELGDKRGVGIALNAIAVNTRNRGDLAGSRSLFEESLSIWKELGDDVMLARLLSNLGNVVKLQGDLTLARSLFDQCFATFVRVGDRAGMAWSLNYAADVALAQGDHVEARRLYDQSLSIFRELGDQWGMAGCLVDFAELMREQADFTRSKSLYAESIQIFQELGHKRGVAHVLESVACAAANEGKAERALQLAGAAAAIRGVLGATLSFGEKVKLDAALEQARASLAHNAASAAWMDGWSMSLETAIKCALEGE